MKLLGNLVALVVGATALRKVEHQEGDNHQILWFKSRCCSKNGGDLCGRFFRSCCQPGRCTALGTCPDQFEYKC